MVGILKKGSTDGRIGPIFFKGKLEIQGPPIWSEFQKRDPRTAESVQILKRESEDPGTADLVRILKKGSTDGRIGPFFKGKVGIKEPPIWSEFLKGVKGSTDRRFGPNFKKESTDGRIGLNFEIEMQ